MEIACLTCREEEEGDERREGGVQEGGGRLARVEEVAEGAAGELPGRHTEAGREGGWQMA